MVSKPMVTVTHIKEIGLMTRQMDKVDFSRLMVTCMKELGNKVWLMDSELIRHVMVRFIVVTGRMISKTGMVRKSGLMVPIMRALSEMV